jgi:beta-N-acetylhexosaminidase
MPWMRSGCESSSTPYVGASGSRRGAVVVAFLTLLLVLSACRTLSPVDRAQVAALEPALGQLFVVGFSGTDVEDNSQLEELLCGVRVGGVLLFGRNVVDAAQVARLTRSIEERSRACTGERPLLIGVDAEGGRVMRLGPAAGYTATLSHHELGEQNDFTLTELEARRIAGRLRAAGINWNLAPVVDVGYNPANPVIVGHGRSFGANPGLVTAHARAYIRAMREEGVLTALKHFPGHGSSFHDSHLGFVDVTDTASSEAELAPYRALIAEGLVDSIMTAHVFNRRLDRSHPATLSRATIAGVLREQLGFDGVVVSDDLRMAAIEQQYGVAVAVVLALQATVDMLLIGDDRLPDGGSATRVALVALREALADGRLSADRVQSALKRVRALTARLSAR